MNKGTFGNRVPDKYFTGEVIASIGSPGVGWVSLDGVNKKLYERGISKNFGKKILKFGNFVWTTRTSTFGTTIINSVAYGNSLWVAGGSTGQLRTSTDAVTWTTRTSTFGATVINSVAYGNSLWVAAGSSGQLSTSTDGITWTTRTSNFGTTAINSVAYGGNNLWVAVGNTGQLRHTSLNQYSIPLQTGMWVKS